MRSFPSAVRQFGLAAHEAGLAPPARPRAYRYDAPARRRVVVRLWIPATPLFWLLSPIPLLLAPLAWLAPPQFRPANPWLAVLAIGRLLTSVGGTMIHVDTPEALVSLRIF